MENSETQKMWLTWTTIFVLITKLSITYGEGGGNILAVYPHFGFSHFKLHQPILNALAARGHQVTVISYVKNSQHPQSNYEELLISRADESQNITTINVVPLAEHTPTRSLQVLLKEYFDLHQEGQESCQLLYDSGHVETVLRRHREKPYDIFLTEYFNSDCQLAMAHQMGLPIVAMSTCTPMPNFYDRIDLPDTPSYIQSEFVGFAHPLNWHERLLNFVQAKLIKFMYKHHTNRADNALIKHHLGLDIDVDAVARRQTAVLFVNQHYTLMGSRPHSRQLVEIGGLHIAEKKKPLPDDIARFLDRSPVGVIFISWGSMVRVSTIDKEKLAAIVEVLRKQPLRVIWRWESDETPNVDPNKFLFVKWAPQVEILCHPLVELFWSHGGMLGTTEGVHCGKRMLLTPIYGDQFTNAFAAQNRGIGLKLDYHNITVESLSYALNELAHPRYSQRAVKLSKVFNEREQKPLDTALWTVEHFIKHGLFAAEVLQSPGIEMNWFIYYSIDSILLLVIPIILLMIINIYLLAYWKRQSARKTKLN